MERQPATPDDENPSAHDLRVRSTTFLTGGPRPEGVCTVWNP